MLHVAGGAFNHRAQRRCIKHLDFIYIGLAIVVCVKVRDVNVLTIRHPEVLFAVRILNTDTVMGCRISVNRAEICCTWSSVGCVTGAAIHNLCVAVG